MPGKWTEIDGEKDREKDGEGEERGIAGIPARTGHTQETGNKKSPTLWERGGFWISEYYSDVMDATYLTSSKSTSSAVGLPLEPLSVGPLVGPCCGPPAC